MSDINTLSGVSDVLEKIVGQLTKIENAQKSISSGMPSLLNSVSGGASVGGAGGSTGATGSAAGVPMPSASFGGAAGAAGGSGGVGGVGKAPLFAGKAGTAAVAMGAAMWGIAPNPQMVMNNAARFYGVGLGTSGYNASSYDTQMRAAMVGGLRNAEDAGVTAGALNAYGIGPGSMMLGSAQDVATLNRVFNWDTSQSANMIGKMSSGSFIGNAYRYGIQLSDDKGNPKSLDEQFNAIYQRRWGGWKPSASGIQNLYRAGGLQNDLSALGMDQTQQEAFVKFAMAKATNPSATVGGLSSNPMNQNPTKSQLTVGESEATKMADATAAVVKGYETAAEIISKVNETYMELPQATRDLVNATKAAANGMQGNGTGNTLLTVGKTVLGMGALGLGGRAALNSLGGGSSVASRVGSALRPVGAVASRATLGFAALGAGLAFANRAETRTYVPQTAEEKKWYAQLDALEGRGDGGIAEGMMGGFDEITALSTFDVRSSTAASGPTVPTTLSGWAAQAASAAGAAGAAPGASGTGGVGKASSKAMLMARWLTSKGMSQAGAAAVIGNLQVESGLNPKALGDGGTSYGLAQWHNDRWHKGLVGYAKKHGGNASAWTTQLGFLMQELQSYGSLNSRLRKNGDAGDLAVAFMQQYERPADHASNGPNAKRRANNAEDIFNTFNARGQGTSRGGGSSGTKGDVAGWFESQIGETKNPLRGGASFHRACLANIRAAFVHFGAKFVSSSYAYQAGERVIRKGMMHKGTDAPRNAIYFWDKSVGGGAGHVAIADGKGNAINNWGGSSVERHPAATMAPRGYLGWAYASALASYSQGAWNIPKDQTAKIHSGEMILNAENAELMRTAIRESLSGSGKGGKTVRIEVIVQNATDAEAIKFAKKVKAHLEEDGMIERMRSR